MSLRLTDIRDLAYRFVPIVAADNRVYSSGPRSWWPAHDIGHFLVATAVECAQSQFGIDDINPSPARLRYVISKELAATSISQRILRQSGHHALADSEIESTDEGTLDCRTEPWYKRAVKKLLHANKSLRLPTTCAALEVLLVRKALSVGTLYFASKKQAESHIYECACCLTNYAPALQGACPSCQRHPHLTKDPCDHGCDRRLCSAPPPYRRGLRRVFQPSSREIWRPAWSSAKGGAPLHGPTFF